MGTSRLSYVLVIAQVGKRGQGNSGGDWDAGEAWGLDDALAEVPTLRKA